MTTPRPRLPLAVLLALLFLGPLVARAHAPADVWTYHRELPAEDMGPAIKGTGQFAKALRDSALGLFTADQANRLERIHAMTMAADEAEAAASEPAELYEISRVRGWASAQLIELLDTHPDLRHLTADADGAVSPAGPMVLDLTGDLGGILLRIDRLPFPIFYTSAHVEIDLATEIVEPQQVGVPVSGTKYTLLAYDRAPARPTRIPIEFVAPGDPPRRTTTMLELRARPKGRLRLAFVDEHSSPTAALVRLADPRSGRLIAIPSAPDFELAMHRISRVPDYWPNRSVFMGLMGDLEGPFWVAPGGIDTTIPAGTYDLTVYRGNEYCTVRRTVTIDEDGDHRETIRLDRWIDMKALGWWSGDGHIHSRLMSDEDASRLLLWMEGMDIHMGNVLEMGNHLRTFYEQRGFGPAFRVARGDRVLVPGQEDPRFLRGHAIGWNITSLVRDDSIYLLNDVVAGRIHEQGGLYGAGHILNNSTEVERDLAFLMPAGLIDFGEILQFRSLGTGTYYEYLDLGFPLTAAAGSDTPYISGLGEVRLYAFLGDQPFGADAWFNAVRAGRTFVSNGPVVFLDVEGCGPGETITVTADRPLRVRVRAEGQPDLSEPAIVELVSFGRVLASVTTSEGETTAEFETTIDAGFGRWVAARVTARDGSFAHTTPVYIVREGFRPWDHARVPELLANRRLTLQLFEDLIDEAGALSESDILPARRPVDEITARSAPALRERLTTPRAAYDELEELWRRESSARQAP